MTRVSCLRLQEYEEKLARLQADYNAEQQSRAKLQEDIAVLRSEYKSKLSEKAPASRGSSVQKNDAGKLSASSKDQCKFTAVTVVITGSCINGTFLFPFLFWFDNFQCF